LDRKIFRAIATLGGIICASSKRPLARDRDRSAEKSRRRRFVSEPAPLAET
jgi:hypothetical protein